MIQRQSHTTALVLDQTEALQFYQEILGFKLVINSPMEDGSRWLTVSPPEQLELQLLLSAVTPGMVFDAETTAQTRSLVAKESFNI